MFICAFSSAPVFQLIPIDVDFLEEHILHVRHFLPLACHLPLYCPKKHSRLLLKFQKIEFSFQSF